ncbi:hypothetical protein C7475_106324 [Chitinophaga sp. S165]|nr:hypothetical protein C7475_106324 [Chitinophaga sp. S165]
MRDRFDFGEFVHRHNVPHNDNIKVSLCVEKQGGAMFIKRDKMLQEGYQM